MRAAAQRKDRGKTPTKGFYVEECKRKSLIIHAASPRTEKRMSAVAVEFVLRPAITSLVPCLLDISDEPLDQPGV